MGFDHLSVARCFTVQNKVGQGDEKRAEYRCYGK